MKDTLTKKQLRVLTHMKDGGTRNWSGTPQQTRESLVKKGLILNLTRGGRHVQWSTYAITDLGRNVLCGVSFDSGLSHGYAGWVKNLNWQLEHDHTEALSEDLEWQQLHGLRYAPNRTIEADVRMVLWKNVTCPSR